jgi:hypothetical protein
MAEKKVIEIEVKTKDAVKSMDDLSKSTKQAGKEFDKAATFAERYGEELQPLTTRMGEAEDRLYELANAGQTTTQEYKDLLKTVGEFRKVQISTDMAVDASASTLGQKLGGALGGVTSGFSLAQGAFAAFGSESKEVEQALLKVQAAMAIQQGVQGIREAIPAIRQLANSIKAAISATGIGLIVVSLGLVYTYWEDISKAIGFAGGETEKYAKQQKVIGEEAKKQREEVAKQSGAFATLISRLKATNQNTKEREELIKKINSQYGTTLKNIKDERNFQEQLNTELASYLVYQKAKYELQKNEDLIVKNLEKQDKIKKNQIANDKELAALNTQLNKLKKEENSIYKDKGINIVLEKSKEQTKIQESLNKELTETEKRFENYGAAANKVEAEIAKLTNGGKKYVEQIKVEKKEGKELIDITKNIEDEKLRLQEDGFKKELDGLKLKYARKKEEEDKQLKEKTLTQKDYETLQEQAIESFEFDKKQIVEKYVNQESELKTVLSRNAIQGLVDSSKTRLEIEKATSEKSIEISKEEAEKKQKIEEKKIQMGLTALSILNDAFQMSAGKSEKDQRKAFKAQKAFNLASAITNTYLAVASALALNPKDSLFPGQRFVEAGLAGAAGAVQVAKIAKTQFEGGSSSGAGSVGGSGATAPTMSAPQFNVVGQSGVNQLASLNQQPIQAYVVSGQVTSQQALDRNRLENATLGG